MPPSLPGSIGKYTVERFIESGGMGDVFLARDPSLDRPVAIKFLREGFDSEEMRERFEREARAAGRLSHPNIVTIYEFGEFERRPFIAMEFVRGEPLSKLIKRREATPLVRKLEMAEGLCSGLGHAHKAGIVHRDIKPANLMVGVDGPLKILDFGIVRMAGSGLTSHGVLVGTVNYMSPEQIAGSGAIDYRSDVFAVGAVLYELFTYQRAFPGEMRDVLYKIVHRQPEAPATLVPGLDAGIVRAIDQCLDKSPDRRYQDLNVLRRDLARLRQRLEREDTAPGRGAPVKSHVAEAPPTPAPWTSPSERERIEEAERGERARFERARIERELAEEARLAEARHARKEADRKRAEDRQRAREEAAELAEARRLQKHRDLAEAKRLVDAGHFADAIQLLTPWGAESGTDATYNGVLLEAESGVARLEVERRQQEALAHHVAAAAEMLARQDVTGASRAVQAILKAHPEHPPAQRLEREIVRAVEARGRAASTVERARALFDARPAEALTLLERFTPPHRLVDSALAELREAFAIREKARLRQEGDERRRVAIANLMARAGDVARSRIAQGVAALAALVLVLALLSLVWRSL